MNDKLKMFVISGVIIIYSALSAVNEAVFRAAIVMAILIFVFGSVLKYDEEKNKKRLRQ